MDQDQPLRGIDHLILRVAKCRAEASRMREAAMNAASGEVADQLFDIAAQYEKLAVTLEEYVRLYSG